MTLDVGRAVEDGIQRGLRRTGLMFMAAFFLLNLGGFFVGQQTASVMMPNAGSVPGPSFAGFSGMIVGVLIGVLSLMVTIIAARTFVARHTEMVPDEFVRRNMGPAVLHMVVGVVAFVLIVLAGLLLFVLPGVYLMLSLLFWSIIVAVEDRGFLDAMRRSWEIVEGERWQVLFLVIVVLLLNALVSIIDVSVSAFTPPVAEMLFTQAMAAFSATLTLAIEADAYNQLVAAADEPDADEETLDDVDAEDLEEEPAGTEAPEDSGGPDEQAEVDYDEVVGGTVDEVKEAVEEDDLDPAKVLEAERDGKDRVTLTSWLEDRTDGD